MRYIERFMATLLFALLTVSSASAQSGTLERMKSTGMISIGYRADQFPFAYEGSNRKPVGYTLDLCRRIIDQLSNQLGISPVQFRLVTLNPGNRVSMVANGTVDMECDLSTDNAGREQQVSFLTPTFVGSTKIVVKSSSGISAVEDLAGKRLLVVAGSSNVQIATALNADRRLNMKIVPLKSGPEALAMVEAGTDEAWLSSDVLIFGLVARSNNPNVFRVLDETFAPRTYAIMVRLQDTAFKDAANSALRELVKSGEFDKIYQRWFQSPSEPGNINLNLPMSDGLRAKLNAVQTGQ